MSLTQEKTSFQVFGQSSFLVALFLLLANDLYLKAEYHNWLTGKLSDFAGLYVFVQFIAAISGIQIVRAAAASACLFVIWKSPASTPLIEFFNSILPVRIHRTVDYTDLAALLVLPLAAHQYANRSIFRWGILKYPSAATAMLAIMATSVLPPTYNIRADFRGRANRETSSVTTYALVESILNARGMQCVSCIPESPYREYVDPQGGITARLHFDETDRKLFVSVLTHTPVSAREKADELQVLLLELLTPTFENVTVTRTSSKYEFTVQRQTSRRLTIEAPSSGFPLNCSENGINHPAITKAIAVISELTNDPTAVNLGSLTCRSNDARCSLGLCRDVLFGKVIGANSTDRSIRVRTRGYVGWGGSTLIVELTVPGDVPGKVEELAGMLENRLRASLAKEVSITNVSTDAAP
jgi:hypothetical protein